MTITRRTFGLGATSLGLAGLMPGAAWSQAAALANLKPGKPYAGTEIKILCVVATQFRAQEARAAAFTEATGITVKYTYVPFPNMREALTAEMVGGTGGYDLVVLEDDKGLWPPYQVAPVIRMERLNESPDIADILNPLAPLLTDQVMADLNWMVDGPDKMEPAAVARQFLTEQGLIQ